MASKEDFLKSGVHNGDLLYIFTKEYTPKYGILPNIPDCIGDKLHFGMYVEDDAEHFMLSRGLNLKTNLPIKTGGLFFWYKEVLYYERVKEAKDLSVILSTYIR
jgi:hypothetical protein